MKMILPLTLMLLTPTLYAETAGTILKRYETEVRQSMPAFAGFSASRGQELYTRQGSGSGRASSCASCHGQDPRQPGRTRANKVIEPLAPSAHPPRFTDSAKVEKWFQRNCDDVLARPCTAQEKGDLITWLLTLK